MPAHKKLSEYQTECIERFVASPKETRGQNKTFADNLAVHIKHIEVPITLNNVRVSGIISDKNLAYGVMTQAQGIPVRKALVLSGVGSGGSARGVAGKQAIVFWEKAVKPSRRKACDALLKYTAGHCLGCDVQLPKGSLDMHHLKPKSAGGENQARNWVLLCRPCNADVGPRNLTIDEIQLRRGGSKFDPVDYYAFIGRLYAWGYSDKLIDWYPMLS